MSKAYKLSKRTIPAAHPRCSVESTAKPYERLQVVYNRFQFTTQDKDTTKINLIFAHGTGMNKAIWTYYVDELSKISKQKGSNFELNCVIAFDAVSHCDSASANEGKLGAEYVWVDGAKDLNEILKHESRTDPSFKEASTIAIGHSLGGYEVLMAAFLEPLLFDSVVTIEPVISPRKISSEGKGAGVFDSLSAIIKTEFNTENEFMDYMKKRSFYKKFHPKIFDDFIEDERLVKPQSVAAKTSKALQMSTYICSTAALSIGYTNLQFIYPPVLHIVGREATWNPPGAAEKVTELIPDCELVSIPEGTHLLHAEIPDVVIKEIASFIQKRARNESGTSWLSSKAFTDPVQKSLVDKWVKSRSKL